MPSRSRRGPPGGTRQASKSPSPRSGRAGSRRPGLPQPVRTDTGVRADLRRRQLEARAAEREARPGLAGIEHTTGSSTRPRPACCWPCDPRAGSPIGGRRPAGLRIRQRATRGDAPVAGARGQQGPTGRGMLHLPGFALEIVSRSGEDGWLSPVRRRTSRSATSALPGRGAAGATSDLITAVHPRPGLLDRVLLWADQLTRDFRDLFGYTLIATTHQVRLVRRLDTLNPSRVKIFTNRAGKAFDRRRLAYLCLVLGSFQRSRVEISLADLVRLFGPVANSIEGLGFDPVVARSQGGGGGRARLAGGAWSAAPVRRVGRGVGAGATHGDALYDIDHDICTVIFKPGRPVQHLTSAAGLLDGLSASAESRVRGRLLEHPWSTTPTSTRRRPRAPARRRRREPGPAHRPGRGTPGGGRPARRRRGAGSPTSPSRAGAGRSTARPVS